jgi:hypothetical protein
MGLSFCGLAVFGQKKTLDESLESFGDAASMVSSDLSWPSTANTAWPQEPLRGTLQGGSTRTRFDTVTHMQAIVGGF